MSTVRIHSYVQLYEHIYAQCGERKEVKKEIYVLCVLYIYIYAYSAKSLCK